MRVKICNLIHYCKVSQKNGKIILSQNRIQNFEIKHWRKRHSETDTLIHKENVSYAKHAFRFLQSISYLCFMYTKNYKMTQ